LLGLEETIELGVVRQRARLHEPGIELLARIPARDVAVRLQQLTAPLRQHQYGLGFVVDGDRARLDQSLLGERAHVVFSVPPTQVSLGDDTKGTDGCE
jgi:hypothetical protein